MSYVHLAFEVLHKHFQGLHAYSMYSEAVYLTDGLSIFSTSPFDWSKKDFNTNMLLFLILFPALSDYLHSLSCDNSRLKVATIRGSSDGILNTVITKSKFPKLCSEKLVDKDTQNW